MPDHRITIADATAPRLCPGDLIDVNGGRYRVIAAKGTLLTVRPCPWWRWTLRRLATAYLQLKWWLLYHWFAALDRLAGREAG